VDFILSFEIKLIFGQKPRILSHMVTLKKVLSMWRLLESIRRENNLQL